MRVVAAICPSGVGLWPRHCLGGHPIGLRDHEKQDLSRVFGRNRRSRARQARPLRGGVLGGCTVSTHDAIFQTGAIRGEEYERSSSATRTTDTRDLGIKAFVLANGRRAHRSAETRSKLYEEPPVYGVVRALRGHMALQINLG